MTRPKNNLTPAENYEYHGAVTPAQMDELLEAHYAVSEQGDIKPYLKDLVVQFPSEDFLQGPIDALNHICKGMRSERRAEIQAVIETLTELQSRTHHDTEEGLDLVAKIRATLNGH